MEIYLSKMIEFVQFNCHLDLNFDFAEKGFDHELLDSIQINTNLKY